MFRIGSRSCLVLNVEKQMITHLAIVDVAVVGSPHEDDGKRPLAFFVLSEDSNVTAEELRSYTNGKFKAIIWGGNWFDAFVNYLGKVMEEEKLRGGDPVHRENPAKWFGQNNPSSTHENQLLI